MFKWVTQSKFFSVKYFLIFLVLLPQIQGMIALFPYLAFSDDSWIKESIDRLFESGMGRFEYYTESEESWDLKIRKRKLSIDEWMGLLALNAFCTFLMVYFLLWLFRADSPAVEQKKLASGVSPRRAKEARDAFIFQTEFREIIYIENPAQGIYVEGGAGSGKSASVIEPLIMQVAEQGFAGFLYDFKGSPPTLSKTLYNALDKQKNRTVAFAHINLSTPLLSGRCNPLDPVYIPNKLYAMEYASAVMKNLNTAWANKADFWADNAIAYLGAIIWFLRVHHPQSCSLPSAILLAMEAPQKSITILSQDEEVKHMIAPISSAFDQGAEKQIAGIFSSLQLPLGKLYTREAFWILSSKPGEEGHVSLDVSNPKHPTFLSVSNDPRLSDALAPMIALIATVCMKNMNQQGQQKAAFILDEAPTLYIPGLETLPATARSNGVCSVICVQDFAQLERMYGRTTALVLRNNLGNQFFGMSSNLETSQYVSKLAGEYLSERTSISEGEGRTHSTVSLSKEAYVHPHDIATQPPGYFTIKVAGRKPAFFATQLKAYSDEDHNVLPAKLSPQTLHEKISAQWTQIHKTMRDILG